MPTKLCVNGHGKHTVVGGTVTADTLFRVTSSNPHALIIESKPVGTRSVACGHGSHRAIANGWTLNTSFDSFVSWIVWLLSLGMICIRFHRGPGVAIGDGGQRSYWRSGYACFDVYDNREPEEASGSAWVQEHVHPEPFDALAVNGSANVTVDVQDVRTLSVCGSGIVTASQARTVETLDITINGSGGCDLSKSKAIALNVDVNGSGHVRGVEAVASARVNLLGSGCIQFFANRDATIDQALLGSGSIIIQQRCN